LLLDVVGSGATLDPQGTRRAPEEIFDLVVESSRIDHDPSH
jgi:hypothetical protein